MKTKKAANLVELQANLLKLKEGEYIEIEVESPASLRNKTSLVGQILGIHFKVVTSSPGVYKVFHCGKR